MGFVFALVIAVFMAGPEIYMRLSLGDAFKGIYMHGSDSELMYLARMQQTYNGISAWDNPFLYEYQGQLPISYALFSEPVLAYPGKWLGIPVQELNIIYKFLFSAGIFLLIYFFAFRLMEDPWWATATVVGIMAGYRLVTVPGIIGFIHWRPVYDQFSVYSRPLTSQVSWVIFWGFLHVLLSGIKNGKGKYFIWNGVLFGLAFYVYPYNWTFLGVFSGIIVLGAFFFGQRKLAGQVLITLCIGASIAIPYALNAYAVTHNQYFDSFSVMTELGMSRKPDISTLGLVAAVVLLLSLKRKRYDENGALLLALLAVTFIVTNQQVITGHVLQVGHYHLFFNVPVYILIFFFVARREALFLRPWSVKLGLTVMIGASLMNAYLMQSSSFSLQAGLASQRQKYAEVLGWFNGHTPRGSVILANENISSLIPAYTHSYAYWNSYALFYLIPPERLEGSLFLRMKLSGVAPAILGGESFFHTDPNERQLGIAARVNIGDVLSGVVRNVYREGALRRYAEFYGQGWSDNIKKFRLDYVVYDPEVDPQWDLKDITFMKPVKMFGDVVIYENTLR